MLNIKLCYLKAGNNGKMTNNEKSDNLCQQDWFYAERVWEDLML
jgi:hypothetical protein